MTKRGRPWLCGTPAATLLVLAVPACSRPVLPGPEAALAAYASAVQRGDAAAVHGMLTRASRRRYGEQGTRRLLAAAAQELRAQARAVQVPDARVEVRAELRFDDGERAEVAWEAGAFRVVSAVGLPARPRTPAQALVELRRAVSRRSYAALLRTLTVESRTTVDRDLTTLVEALEGAEGAVLEVRGDQAVARLPGGRVVELAREDGVWRVRDFD